MATDIKEKITVKEVKELDNYTLAQLEKKFRISPRKTAFLIRNNWLTPIIDEGMIFISHNEIMRYLGLPEGERKKHHVSYLSTLGPGLITGAADDDSAGVMTYSIVGAAFGLALSWLAVYLVPMMISVQETCARIGIVTGKGLAGSISKHFGKKVIFVLAMLLVVANTINIGADIGGMAIGLKLLFPVNFYVAAIGTK